MEKDLQAKADAELAKISDAADGEVPVVHAFPTWKLFLIGLGALLLLFVTFLVLDLENVGAAIFMAGLLVLTLYSAFRSAPPLRKHPGGGGNIDFGNR